MPRASREFLLAACRDPAHELGRDAGERHDRAVAAERGGRHQVILAREELKPGRSRRRRNHFFHEDEVEARVHDTDQVRRARSTASPYRT
jgi:hypothetical protein